MGELKVANQPGFELAVVGLGSCIALTLTDRDAGVAGMAHVVLPLSPTPGTAAPGPSLEDAGCAQPGKYADTAVPALIDAVVGAGARRRRLSAVLIGGARMFETGLDIGSRNAEAVRAGLTRAGIPVTATDVGGTRGRTARVTVGGEISSQMAGEQRTVLGSPHLRTRVAVVA